MGVSSSTDVSRVVTEVNQWLLEEPAKELAAKAVLSQAPTPLKNPECEEADVARVILLLSSRDVSDKGYSRDKLLGLLRSRCGPLGDEEAAKLTA